MADEATAAQMVLIVDDDLGLVCWLGDILSEAGARSVPALSCGEVTVLIKRLGIEPDLIILNSSLDQPRRSELRKGAKSAVSLADRAIGNLQHWLIGTYHGVSK